MHNTNLLWYVIGYGVFMILLGIFYIVIHSRQVGLNGYRAECERTFFIGEPTQEQKDAFQLAYEAQQAALDIIKVGTSSKEEVNEVAQKIFEEAGVEQYSIHRTGHGIGIGLHEEPFYDTIM